MKKNYLQKILLCKHFLNLILIYSKNLFDKRYLFFQNSLIVRTIRKTSVLLKFRASEERRNVIACSFIIQRQEPSPPVLSYYTFPYFFSTLFCLSFRGYGSLERRKTGAELTKTIKSDFFPSRRSPRSSCCGFRFFRTVSRLFSHSYIIRALLARKNPQAHLKKHNNYMIPIVLK